MSPPTLDLPVANKHRTLHRQERHDGPFGGSGNCERIRQIHLYQLLLTYAQSPLVPMPQSPQSQQVADQAQTTMPSKNEDSPLFRLPAELVIEIYKFALEGAMPRCFVKRGRETMFAKPALLRVCRRIRVEADEYLHKQIMAYVDELADYRVRLMRGYLFVVAGPVMDEYVELRERMRALYRFINLNPELRTRGLSTPTAAAHSQKRFARLGRIDAAIAWSNFRYNR